MSEPPLTATFDPALPTDLDRARQALGDTDTSKPLFPDVTYEAKLMETGGAWRLAAAAMARSLAAQAAQKMESFSAGSDPAISWGNRTRRWLDVAVALEREHAEATQPDDSAAGTVAFAMPARGDDDYGGEYSNGLKGWR